MKNPKLTSAAGEATSALLAHKTPAFRIIQPHSLPSLGYHIHFLSRCSMRIVHIRKHGTQLNSEQWQQGWGLAFVPPSQVSGISSDILSGRPDLLTSYVASYLAFSLAFYIALFLEIEVRRGPQRSDSRRLKSGEAHSAQTLAGWSPAKPTARRLSPVEVRRSPQRAGSRRLKSGEAHSAQTLAGWSPARPTAIKSWQMRSGEDHCDQELAEEVRRRPLRKRTGRWGPAKITAIKSWQMRSSEEGRRRRKEEEGGRRRRTTSRRSRASDIKPNNPHLAGGE